jgi:hypothetical protein
MLRAYALTIPWVRELPERRKPIPCKGIKWSKVSMQRGITDAARCKLRAHYRYTAQRGRNRYGETGNYCLAHVEQQLANEWDRYDAWRKATERTD